MRDWREEIRKTIAVSNLDPAREQEIVEELSQHILDQYQEMIDRGISPEDAEASILSDLNSGKLTSGLRASLKTPPKTAPVYHDEPGNMLSGFWKDLRYGARLLRLNPGFAIVAILSLALGIGANTAIFQLLNSIRLRSLPVHNPQELADVRVIDSGKGRTGWFSGRHPQLTYALWENIRDQQQAFSSISVWNMQRLNLSRGGEARYANAMFVSGSFFQTVGVKPVLGRVFNETDDVPGCGSPQLVISNSFWQREYGGSSSAIGRRIHVEGHPFEIIGVTPAGFFGVEVGRHFDIVLPLCSEPLIAGEEPRTANRQAWWLAAIGRLKPGWSVEQTSAHLKSISKGIFESTLPPDYDAVDRSEYLKMKLNASSVSSGVSYLRREYETPLWFLLAISGLVLLIACANLANLMFARASARGKEMAVRLALGASRMRLIRQLLAESLLLAIIGALAGAVLAQVLSRFLVAFLSTTQSRLFLDLNPDWRVFAFTTALAIFTCLLFGLTPAVQASRTTPGEAMKANSRALTGGSSRFAVRRILVVSQVALSLVLLTGAFLFVRTFRNLLTVNAGFQQENLLIAEFDFTPLKIPMENRIQFRNELLERMRNIPSVSSAASLVIVPVGGGGWNNNINIPEAKLRRQVANFNRVSAGYFQTVRTPLLAGRDFNEFDNLSSPKTAIVTETFSKKFLNGANPIGKTFSIVEGDGEKTHEIVGMVKDAKYSDLREEFTPIVFVPDTQEEEPQPWTVFVLRSDEPLVSVISAVKQISNEVNPSMILNFRIFKTIIREGLIREGLMATLSGFFGLLAAVLAMTGLYGVMSFMVARRRNEIGIRIALGASKQSILRLILSEAAGMLLIGLSVGIILAVAGGFAAKAMLFGLKPTDPFTLLVAVSSLAVVAVAASFFPARRAAGLDPMQALREE